MGAREVGPVGAEEEEDLGNRTKEATADVSAEVSGLK